ncbi:ankyrin [Penicillium lividum]|nr:ankyrin [Penicillium lividum]
MPCPLPLELWQQILSSLTLTDINSLVLTSRYFYVNFTNLLYQNEIKKNGGHLVLLYAAQTGSTRTVERLLDAERSSQPCINPKRQEGPQINPNSPKKGCDSWSPLAWASVRGFEDMVKLLLGMKNIEPDAECPRGRTPLSYAAQQGHVGIVKLLLEAGADPNSQAELERTPLHWAGTPSLTRGINYQAIEFGDRYTGTLFPNASCKGEDFFREAEVESFRLKVKSSALPIFTSVDVFFDKDVPGTEAWNQIHNHKPSFDLINGVPSPSVPHFISYDRWSSGDNFEEILDLLLQHGAEIDTGMCTPLAWAAAFGYAPLVKLLISRGAQVTFQTGTCSPLAMAGKHGHASVLKIILDHCPYAAEPKYTYGPSALALAAMNAHVEAVKILLAKTTERERSPRGPDWQPLTMAARKGHILLVELLISAHKEKWPDQPLGYTAISEAVICGHTKTVQCLLSAGADIHATPGAFGKMGCLHLAAKSGHADVVKCILETEQVDVNTIDGHGWTAYSWTTGTERRTRMQQILLNYGADPSFQKSIKEIARAPHSILIVGNGGGFTWYDGERWPISFR